MKNLINSNFNKNKFSFMNASTKKFNKIITNSKIYKRKFRFYKRKHLKIKEK